MTIWISDKSGFRMVTVHIWIICYHFTVLPGSLEYIFSRVRAPLLMLPSLHLCTLFTVPFIPKCFTVSREVVVHSYYSKMTIHSFRLMILAFHWVLCLKALFPPHHLKIQQPQQQTSYHLHLLHPYEMTLHRHLFHPDEMTILVTKKWSKKKFDENQKERRKVRQNERQKRRVEFPKIRRRMRKKKFYSNSSSRNEHQQGKKFWN